MQRVRWKTNMEILIRIFCIENYSIIFPIQKNILQTSQDFLYSIFIVGFLISGLFVLILMYENSKVYYVNCNEILIEVFKIKFCLKCSLKCFL